MPLNEAERYHPSNLTEKEQREAVRALYGLAGEHMHNPNPTDLTYEERVMLRRLLDDADQKDAANAMREFDLNKPPVPPYVYREYPRLLYNHQTKQNKRAHTYEQQQSMLAEGWSEQPLAPQILEVELTAQEQEEAEAIDKQLVKKGRGK